MAGNKLPGYCVLSRCKEEKVYLIPKDAKGKEDALEIIVADVQVGRVKIGIKAPENYVIVRAELVPNGNLGDYISGGEFLAESEKAEDVRYNR